MSDNDASLPMDANPNPNPNPTPQPQPQPIPSRWGAVLGAGFGAYQGFRAGNVIDDMLAQDSPPMDPDQARFLTDDPRYGPELMSGDEPSLAGIGAMTLLGGYCGWKLGERNPYKSALLGLTAIAAVGALSQLHQAVHPDAGEIGVPASDLEGPQPCDDCGGSVVP
jgi:hypothetical protein